MNVFAGNTNGWKAEMGCIDKETASAYLSGYLETREAQEWAVHVAECAACQQVVEEVSGLLDDVRRALVMGEVAGPDDDIPSPELVRRSARRNPAPPADSGPLGHLFRRVGRPRWAIWQRWATGGAMALLALVAAFAVLQFISSRSTLEAKEILRRADLAAHTRAYPGHIVRRVWKDSLTNGYGPLPDGEYRVETWRDAIDNRYAVVRYDAQGHLRQGSWRLPDGTSYVFRGEDESRPQLVVWPSDADINAEIERLPVGIRERVRADVEHSRRPYPEIAAESAVQTERELSDLAGSSTVHEVTLPTGAKLFRVTSHVESKGVIPHWDVTKFIEDQTFLMVAYNSTGYRNDGLLYQRNDMLMQEQVFAPGEADLHIFVPGPFPAATEKRTRSPGERVHAIEVKLGLVPPSS